jgi:hypothetical protein
MLKTISLAVAFVIGTPLLLIGLFYVSLTVGTIFDDAFLPTGSDTEGQLGSLIGFGVFMVTLVAAIGAGFYLYDRIGPDRIEY